MSDELRPYLEPGTSIDSTHPAVVALAQEHGAGIDDVRERAVALYYAVRDGFLYDPYGLELTATGFRASTVIERGGGFCVPKATLLAAVGRAAGIPARIGFADVRNHMTSPRLMELMGTDVFAYHGYAELWIDGRWVKATPAFNLSLCQKVGVQPLEFDGREDSLFHPLDLSGRRHMEYLRDHGSFVDVPVDRIVAAWAEIYPRSGEWGTATRHGASFESEAVTVLPDIVS
ncbi:transglutaminase-like domain-containing protein [Paraconexibacter antarcticus]|uniref:Transglutaminase-like domain-containing protein n=1 Tax=Paraconexibacter antarcticus TaxID=2949664 RepID=A0ABY5DW37_9ACTN|nr:transglutaminase-like domain-containing protein [Paraconexibacter antarcticus]UTI66215.1 transglutaminase-like domain-containing protein [Paraconexibacter antarcticus]